MHINMFIDKEEFKNSEIYSLFFTIYKHNHSKLLVLLLLSLLLLLLFISSTALNRGHENR